MIVSISRIDNIGKTIQSKLLENNFRKGFEGGSLKWVKEYQ